MAERITWAGSVREIVAIEARAGVANENGNLFAIEAAFDPDQARAVVAMPPLDGIGHHFADSMKELANLESSQATTIKPGGQKQVQRIQFAWIAGDTAGEFGTDALSETLLVNQQDRVEGMSELLGRERGTKSDLGFNEQSLLGKRTSQQEQGSGSGLAMEFELTRQFHRVKQDQIGLLLRDQAGKWLERGKDPHQKIGLRDQPADQIEGGGGTSRQDDRTDHQPLPGCLGPESETGNPEGLTAQIPLQDGCQGSMVRERCGLVKHGQ